jgi:hypothetical protein
MLIHQQSVNHIQTKEGRWVLCSLPIALAGNWTWIFNHTTNQILFWSHVLCRWARLWGADVIRWRHLIYIMTHFLNQLGYLSKSKRSLLQMIEQSR